MVILFLVIQLFRKRKQSWKILFAELICLILFFYLRFLAGGHKIIFIGDYSNDKGHWESGLANVGVYTYNLAILMGIFAALQILFWIIYSKRVRLINLKVDMNSFLDPSK